MKTTGMFNRKHFLFFLFLLLMFGLLITSAQALTYGDFEYQVSGDEIHITKYNGKASAVTVPESIEGKNVVSVNFSGLTNKFDYTDYMSNYTVKKVILPPTIQDIEPLAFYGFAVLWDVEGLQYVRSVGQDAFLHLHKADFSTQLKIFYPFSISAVYELIIPDDLFIETLPISDLEKISLISSGNTPELSIVDGVLFSADKKTLIKYPANRKQESYIIPNGTNAINEYAFFGIGNYLVELTIPKSVTEIHSRAFDGSDFNLCVYRNTAGYQYAQNWNQELGYLYISVVGEDQSLMEMLDSIVMSCQNGSETEYETALFLHDWIISNVEYDYTLTYTGPVAALIEGKTICDGYAELYKLLLTHAGIRNGISGNFDHKFNAVFLEQEWCYVDCTWDDTANPAENPVRTHIYFGIDDTIRKYIYGYGDSFHSESLENHYFNRMHYTDADIQYYRIEAQKQLDEGLESFIFSDNISSFYNDEVTWFIVANALNGSVWDNGTVLVCEYDPKNHELHFRKSGTEIENSEYEFEMRNNALCLTKYLGQDTDVIVPSEICGVPVRYLEQTFMDNSTVCSVLLPSGLLEIGQATFKNCYALETINFPETITCIDDEAFYNCTGLTSDIILPTSVNRIGVYAFQFCQSITKLVLPDGLQYISSGAFGYCYSLLSVKLPDDLENLPFAAFYACYALESISLPQTIKSIGRSCFDYTAITEFHVPASLQEIQGLIFNEGKLMEIYVDPNNEFFATDENHFILYSSDMKTIYFSANQANVSELTIPPTVTEIKESAFAYNPYLQKVTVQAHVLGKSMFYGCKNLKDVTLAEGIKVIPEYCFLQTGLLTIQLPQDLEEIKIGGLSGIYLRTIAIPAGVTSISQAAFPLELMTLYVYGDSYGLEFAQQYNVNYELIDPDKHTPKIKVEATVGCLNSGNTEYYICSDCNQFFDANGNVIEKDSWIIPPIGHHEEIIIPAVPNNCVSTGWTEGKRCAVCDEVLIEPQSTPINYRVHHLEGNRCSDCNKTFNTDDLSVIRLPENDIEIEEEAFCDIDAQVVVLSSPFAMIASKAFKNCSNLKYIYLPKPVEYSIPEDAFENCPNLQILYR